MTEQQRYSERLLETYTDVVRSAHSTMKVLPFDIALEDIFVELGFEPVERGEALEVVSKGHLLHTRRYEFGMMRILEWRHQIYLDLESSNDFLFLRDSKRKGFDAWLLWMLYGGFSLLLVAAYTGLYRNLLPLRSLEKNIERFSQGDLDINCHSDKQDEIARVANAFDKAAHNIRELIRSRQMFLRMIMHELKTPLTKGRISAEMLEEGKQKARVIKTFERLDDLINEFSRIEQITSGNYKILAKHHGVSTVIEHALEMLMCDSSRQPTITINPQSQTEGDLELLAIAIKNLLDNGLKYGEEVRCEQQGRMLLISNAGEPMDRAWEEYRQPFHKGTNSQGLGLGIYLVETILQLHNMTLSYEYREGRHCFLIHNFSAST